MLYLLIFLGFVGKFLGFLAVSVLVIWLLIVLAVSYASHYETVEDPMDG